MNGTWGVYDVCGRLPGGKETTVGDRAATKCFVRWRVDGRMRRRTSETKTHARQWRETLIAAKNQGWTADGKGWPISPVMPQERPDTDPAPGSLRRDEGVLEVETYINDVWWPAVSVTLGDKSRLGHRRNADLAVRLLRVSEADVRQHDSGASTGDSLPLT